MSPLTAQFLGIGHLFFTLLGPCVDAFNKLLFIFFTFYPFYCCRFRSFQIGYLFLFHPMCLFNILLIDTIVFQILKNSLHCCSWVWKASGEFEAVLYGGQRVTAFNRWSKGGMRSWRDNKMSENNALQTAKTRWIKSCTQHIFHHKNDILKHWSQSQMILQFALFCFAPQRGSFCHFAVRGIVLPENQI